MGKDKYENEDLIAYGWPEDVWFHVDDVSSAHVYIRLNKGETIDDIPEETLEDVFQLVKNHSISGCKMPKVNIVYTNWSNLRKGQDMDTGTIGFFNMKAVHKKIGVSRDRMIVNRIEKTKVEAQPDFKKEREERDAKELREKKKEFKEQRIREKAEEEENRKKKEAMSYDRIFEHTELMDYNDFMDKSGDVTASKAYEEDFIIDKRAEIVYSCAMEQEADTIAIVGMGMRAPEADDIDSFWRLLEEKRDVTREIPKERFNTDFWCNKTKFKGSSISFRGGFIDSIRDFDAPFFNLSANEARELDPQIRLLLETAWNAIEDAGITLDESTTHGGVFIGHMTHDYMEILSSSRYSINSHCMQGNAETMAANRLSYFFNMSGPSVTYNTACSSSLVAIHGAVQAIQSGECDWAIAGGANALLDPRYFIGFTDWGTMSPDGHCFSFDSRGNGYVRCEGAGIIVLKSLRAAQAAGDRIYAVIRGCGVNHDGAKPAITNPRGEMQQELLERVCRVSHTDPTTVAYAEAHGTGTVAGDKTEARALSGAFCKTRRAAPLLIGSLKSNFGHMEGAAGVASVVKAALCVYTGKIPATIKVQQRNPNILWEAWQLDLPLEETPFPEAKDHPRRAVVSSFGIGGTNACFILEQAPPMTVIPTTPCLTSVCEGACVDGACVDGDVGVKDVGVGVKDGGMTNGGVGVKDGGMTNGGVGVKDGGWLTNGGVDMTNDGETHVTHVTGAATLPVTQPPSEFILLWSAKTETASRAVSRQLLSLWSRTQDLAALQSLCWTLATHRTLLPERSAVVGDAVTIATALEQYSEGTLCRDVIHATALEHATRPVCFVFCGQGAQWRGMGKDCLDSLPVYCATLQECARIVKKLGGWDLLAAMDGEEANTTRVSQPATTAVQLALVEQLRSWGVTAAAAVGHSSGEICAAYTAGAVTLEEAMELAFYRGSAITEHSGNAGNAGGMAAVGLSEAQLTPYLEKYPKLVIGCYNSPNALTVSGDKAQLEALCAELQHDGVFCRPLVVTHAFHSPFMEPAMPAYRAAIRHVKGRALRCRLFSSLRGEEVTDAAAIDAEYFVENLTHPVRFPDAVGRMGEAFPQAVFLEVGPHPALHRPVVQCLKGIDGVDTRVLGTLDRRMAGPTALRKCVAGLACCGCAARTALEAFIPPCVRCLNLPHYPFERKPLWFESEQSFRFRCPRLDHPVLGVPQMAPLPTWENDLNVETIPWVQDHVVSGSCLAPGAMYLDMALAAGCLFYGSSTLSLTDCCFLQALVLPAQGHVQLRTTLDAENGEVRIYHRDAPEDVARSFAEPEKRRWTLHFRCYAHPEPAEWCEAECAAALEAARECTAAVNVEALYHRMGVQGLQFGPQFQSLRHVAVGLEEGVCDVGDV
ncbi:hypothetical protein BLSTO_04303 [Blastocystis sp. subtype 1]